MKLSKKERFMIANQLKILEALYPDDASSYAIQRTAFETGYESHYNWAMENISEKTLSQDLTREVIDTLDMFRAIHFYIKDKKDIKGIDKSSLKFAGYDGNDELECKLMGYARYFVIELGRFSEILEEEKYFDFNSHYPIRNKYKEMLQEWFKIAKGSKEGQRHNLTREQLINIIGKE